MEGIVEKFTAPVLMKVFLGQISCLRISVYNFMNIQRNYVVYSVRYWWKINDTNPKTRINLFHIYIYIYIYYSVTLNTLTCFCPQGTTIRGSYKVIQHKTISVTFLYCWVGAIETNGWNVAIYVYSCCINVLNLETNYIRSMPTYITKDRAVQHSSLLQAVLTVCSRF
jgi:hypothetical protein